MITNNKPLEILRSFHQQHAAILSLQTAFSIFDFLSLHFPKFINKIHGPRRLKKITSI